MLRVANSTPMVDFISRLNSFLVNRESTGEDRECSVRFEGGAESFVGKEALTVAVQKAREFDGEPSVRDSVEKGAVFEG